MVHELHQITRPKKKLIEADYERIARSWGYTTNGHSEIDGRFLGIYHPDWWGTPRSPDANYKTWKECCESDLRIVL